MDQIPGRGEGYWFHRMELPGGIVTPGWRDPKVDKLPYFGLSDDMTGMRVLDIGAAEGFFAFEAERRRASEVVAVENYPPMVRKFNICRFALDSRAEVFRANVYDLDPRAFGTFDMVFFGVLYHLRLPILALHKAACVCTVCLLMQTAIGADATDTSPAEFHPFGIMGGLSDRPSHDPTCFWFPNCACCGAMLEHVGFEQIKEVQTAGTVGAVFRARSPIRAKGRRPNETCAPWS